MPAADQKRPGIAIPFIIAVVVFVASLAAGPCSSFADESIESVRTIYVDDDAPAGGDGSSWVHSYRHLQDALATALAGDTIMVAQGAYKPDEGAQQTDGDRYATFNLVDGAKLKGGYAGLTAQDCNDRNITSYRTTLTGEIGALDDDSDNAYTVVTATCVDSNTVIDGFTITGGRSQKWGYDPAGRCGGGMFNYAGNPTIKNCVFTDNTALRGGGMCNWGDWDNSISADPNVINCVFANNHVTGVTDEPRDWHGGGMNNDYGSPVIVNCTFAQNSSLFHGGGLSNAYFSNALVYNCIFWGNTAEGDGRQTFDTLYSSGTYSHCDIQGGGNSGAETWNTEIGIDGGGNIDADPCFAGHGYRDDNGTADDYSDDFWVSGDYRILYDSPCLDAGDPLLSSEAGGTDVAGRPRIVGRGIDIGAHEYAPGDLNDDRRWDFRDLGAVLSVWLDQSCSEPDWCLGTDFNRDGRVNQLDLALLGSVWKASP